MSEELKLNLTPSLEGNKLKIVQNIGGEVAAKIIDFQEQANIQALIKLGWTPPDTKPTFTKEDVEKATKEAFSESGRVSFDDRVRKDPTVFYERIVKAALNAVGRVEE